MVSDRHMNHVYNRFVGWLFTLRHKNQEALSLPRLVLFDWFIENNRFKLNRAEVCLFLEQRYLLEVLTHG